MCGCYRGGWQCDQTCLGHALVEESLFYPIGTVSVWLAPLLHDDLAMFLAQNLYNNLTYMYPTANIWITGHSLGW